MRTTRVTHSTPAADDARRPGLSEILGKTLATDLAMYRGLHS